jgi:hypothetical protein
MRRLGRLMPLIALVACGAGCGLDIKLTGGGTVGPGGSLTYQVKLTNVSACPLRVLSDPSGPDFAFVPFVPASTVNDVEILRELCGLEAPVALTPGLAAAGTVTSQAAQEFLHAVASAATQTECSGTGIVCETNDEVAFCQTGALAPGAMRTLNCTAQSGTTTGRFYSFALGAQVASGVCAAGPGAGTACTSDNDCAMGSGTCAPGICVGGMNAGNGCDPQGDDCPSGSCTACADNMGLGVACAAVDITTAPAPAVSPLGLAVAVVMLCAIAAVMLRRRSRSRTQH